MTVRFLHAAVAQRVDQRLGNAAQAEAADGQQLAVLATTPSSASAADGK
jgi:hypothetical protein